MTDHLERDDVRQYLDGAMAPGRLLSASRHLRSCGDCAAELEPDIRQAEHIVRGIMARAAHPGYEQLEACVDGTAEPATRSYIEHHLRWCRACAAEFHDLGAAAASLRGPLPAFGARQRSGWRAWLDGGQGWRIPSLAGAALAVLFAVGVAVESGLNTPVTGDRSSAAATVDPAAPAFDVRVFNELDRVSPAAAEAWRRDDPVTLAGLLEPAAARGDAIAAEALGLLYARGLGVPANEAAAARLWDQAARAGSVSALHNLRAIGRG